MLQWLLEANMLNILPEDNMLKMYEYVGKHAAELARGLLVWKDTGAVSGKLQELADLCESCAGAAEGAFILAETLITYEALERLAQQPGHEQS